MILSFPLLEQFIFAVIAAAVLLLPGLVWTAWMPRGKRDPLARLADTVGLSVAFIAFLGQVFFVLGWHFPGWLVYLLLTLAFLAVIAAGLLGKFDAPNISILTIIVGAAVLLGLIYWRFLQAETLVFPAWVDSVHHVLVTQKIIDHGGVPQTLGPELPVPFHYHYGFHITAALFTWLSKLPASDGVLWIGQVINALVAVGIYRVTKSVWKDSRAAAIAALFTMLAFQMPAYYLTWGRYTLLTGILIMLPAMATAYDLLYDGFTRERTARLIALVTGLSLTHYMALFFLGLFVGALLIVKFVAWLRLRLKKEAASLRDLSICAAASLGGIVLALPWLIRMLSALHKQARVEVVMPSGSDPAAEFDYILYLLGPKHNYVLLIAAAVFLILAWWKKEARPLALWATLLLLLNLPWGLRIGPFRPDHYTIVLFIPAAILLGGGLLWLARQLTRFLRSWIAWLILAAVAAAGLIWGMRSTQNVLNPVTVLADEVDRAALDWVNRNTPPEARFLANTTHWIYSTHRGVDGGYWIMPYTRRFTTALPGLYSYAEHDVLNDWRDWSSRTTELTTCDDAFWSLVKDAELTHLYLRDGKGSLQPEAVLGCQGIVPVYQKDGVSI